MLRNIPPIMKWVLLICLALQPAFGQIGDVNDDRQLDLTDFREIVSRFAEPAHEAESRDLNRDGVINLLDMSRLISMIDKMEGADYDEDGDYDLKDQVLIFEGITLVYNPRLDLNVDGQIDRDDATQFELYCDRPECGTEESELQIIIDSDRTVGVVDSIFNLSGRALVETEAITSWQWKFPDGSTQNGQELQTSFSEEGVHVLQLTASQASGVSHTVTAAVTVLGASGTVDGLSFPDLPGDANGDGVLDLKDVLLTSKATTGLVLKEDLVSGDMNFDDLINENDVATMASTVLDELQFPREIVPERGWPGTLVQLRTPVNLNFAGVVKIRVGNSLYLQQPTQLVRGRLNITIPFDPVIPGSVEYDPQYLDIQILQDDVVVESFEFFLEEKPDVVDPRSEVLTFLDTQQDLIDAALQSYEETLLQLDLDTVDLDLLSDIGLATMTEARGAFEHLRYQVENHFSDDMVGFLAEALVANGYSDFQTQVQRRFYNPKTSDEVCSTILPNYCNLKSTVKLLDQGITLATLVCDALLVAVAVAAASPVDGPLLESIGIAAWLAACRSVKIPFVLFSVMTGFVSNMDADLSIELSTSTLSAGETATVAAYVSFVGADDICSYGAGKFQTKIVELALNKMLRGGTVMGTLAHTVKLFSDGAYKALIGMIEKSIKVVATKTGLQQAITRFGANVCDHLGVGSRKPIDLTNHIFGNYDSFGELDILPDGTAEYTCHTAGTATFSAYKIICGKSQRKNGQIVCNSQPVMITMGDNGSLLDDIFEVRVNGATVLTSSVPVVTTSTTINLPPGEHSVTMLGRAAPDGVGTYFIHFSGIESYSGDALSGTDLTPGVQKNYTIVVGGGSR